jgi:WD40 repeat protein
VLFDIQKGGIVHELEQRGNILSLAVSGNGRYALFGLDDKKARYWDLRSGKPLRDITIDGRVRTVALSHDGSLAFVSGGQDEAGIYDMRSGALKSELDYSNPVFPTFSSFISARFYQDGTRLLTGNTIGALEYWNIIDGKRLQRWITPMQNRWRPTNFSVMAVALRASDQQVLAMASNGMIHQFEYALD